MKRRKIDARRVKTNRCYTINEAAARLGVHKRTVENWISIGLPCLKDHRPYLILGWELKGFLEKRRAARRQKCKAGQLYCLKCRTARRPAGGMLDYLPVTLVSGNLQGICEVCSNLMFRRVSLNKICEVTAGCDVAFPHGQQRLTVSG
jgi:excisionase family DNA binding protein